MDMGWSAWPQPLTCQNAQLTVYDSQNRTKNGHGIISMISVTNIRECTTHQLWLPEQGKEWTWDDQHDHSHQYSRMHSSPPMVAKAGPRMDVGWSAWSQPTWQDLQLTSYDCQSQTKNGHVIISMTIITSMPECTPHLLWFPEQDNECT